MNSLPQVSVVMSVYNGEQQLAGTLDSVLSQADCDFELIVVNDGSRDGSSALLKRYAAHYGRLRVFDQENAGLTRALIRGCEEARGVFIARQDVGDISLPGRLAKQASALLDDESLSFVSCHSRFVGPEGEFLFTKSGNGVAHAPIDIIDLRLPKGAIDGPSAHPSVMFRKDKFVQAGGYRPEFYFAQDWDLWYRLGTLGKFRMLAETLLQVQIDLGGISTTSRHLQEALAKLALQSLKLRLRGESDAGVLDQARLVRPQANKKSRRPPASRGLYFVGECLRRNGDTERAGEYFWRAIRSDPASVKSWVRLAQIRMTTRGKPASD
jgi:glycosyltransferase involved in cell wall biosynthesis